MALRRRDVLALTGWGAAVLVIPVAIDSTAIRRGLETMSRLWARGVLHPVAGPAVAGASFALAWHLGQVTLDEWIRRKPWEPSSTGR